MVAVDLSQAMLERVQVHARGHGLGIESSGRLTCLRANLCRLGALPDGGFDYALSMFSTLGMIRGPVARERALAEVARVLRPGGRLALHAHNLWLNLRNPQGRRWLLGQSIKLLTGRDDAGDRRMNYRGIPNMEVHLYRWGELKRGFRAAGFAIDEVVSLDEIKARPISLPWLWPGLRAGGWIVFTRRMS